MKFLAFASGLLVAPCFAFAQWAQEPSSVMGIELGAPKESIARCPPGNAALQSKTLCLEDSAYDPTGYGNLWGLPFGFVLGSGSVRFVDGRVAQISMTMRRDESFDRMKAILVERYGPPHQVKVQQVTATSGAVLASEESLWQGRSAVILLSERAGRIDRSRVAFSYGPLVREQGQIDRRDVKSGASKL